MKYPNWKIPAAPPAPPPALLEAGYAPLLAAVLHCRGLDTPEAAAAFLSGGLQSLQNPWLLRDMDKAAARLDRAIAAGEKVAVYGDYDVDGITAGCLMTDYLRFRGLDCRLYIPDRLEEGYGVNTAALRNLRSQGVSLVVTVDCGVTAVEEAEAAASLGLDLIITDHHQCRAELPRCAAVVDPMRPDCGYPNRELAGVGVAFKLACALEGNSRRCLLRYADLVAVGTVADVMDITGENRYIVRVGLDKLYERPRPGLQALLEAAGLGGKRPTATSVGFTLAPRINAAGRLGKAGVAAELILETAPARCRELADTLCQMNRERQAIEGRIWAEAKDILSRHPPTGPIVLAGEGWHQGVIGIAASRLAEAYRFPAVMICLDGDLGKGSCRSYGGFPLYDALAACREYLEGFGGHAMAAGLTIRRESLEGFRRALNAYYAAHPPRSAPCLEAELRIEDPRYLEMGSVASLDLLEPCGNGNPQPQLCMTDVRLESIMPMGKGKHLRLRLSKFRQNYEAVFFSQSLSELGLAEGQRADVMFFPQINEFRSRRSVQLLVTDLRPAQ